MIPIYDTYMLIEHKIVLIGGERLTSLMISNDIGVSTEVVYEIKK
jgi:restriction endonuclease Mrr